ncbi:hypothetical protein GCM10009639_49860 [Kitasatospora putterlickiae]|uniref:Uncharacterized protein n=1 Tax=Kitasatospora putterlickiae TaxID=221725 RepID=A0ABN1YEG2_9ACTN
MVPLDGDVQQHAERPQVRGRVALLAADPLRRDVLGRADQRAGGGERGGVPHRGDAEVGEDGGAVRAQQHVAGLDVAVLDAGRVRGAQRGEHTAADPGGLGDGERAAGDPVGEAAAGDQFHDQPGVGVPGGVDDVVDHRDVRVLEAGERAGLAQHALAQFVGGGGVGRGHRRVRRADLLERDLAVQHGVAGAPDQSHAPAAEAFQQFEAVVDEPRPRPPSVHADPS